MVENDLLDPDKIKANLKTKRIGKKVLVYNSTSSTNDIAFEYAANKRNDGLVIFAEEQTAGRGRTGAKWISSRAESILCSVVLTKIKSSSELLSLATAVAVAETIGKNAKIKWPNDIVLNGKKTAGILLESKTCDSHTVYIIGIGINCHQKEDSFPPELRAVATSIDIETKTVCDRISLSKRLLYSLDHWLESLKKDGTAIVEKWSEWSSLLGQRITIIYDGIDFTGNCIGVDPEKGLILQLDTGGVRMFDAAHTSILK